MSRYQLEQAMRQKLMVRIMDHALANRSNPKWKRRLYAMSYGAGLKRILTGGI